MHQGWDYKLYRIWAFGGFFLYGAFFLSYALWFDLEALPGREMTIVLGGPLLLYLAGIFLYWWWVFLFKGNRELEELSQTQEEGVPGIKALKSWSTLHQAMAIHGGSAEELIKDARRARRPILVWYGWINLMLLWIVGPLALGSLGIYQGIGPELWLVGIGIGIAVLLVGTPFLVGWGGGRAEKAYLVPLGLAVTRSPGLEVDPIGLTGGGQPLIPDGPAIVEGERYGRLVHIETIGKHCLTVVQARMPAFKVESNNGKLVPDKGAPEAVAKALKSLRKAKRWRGIVVYGGQEGVAIQRESRGTNMWLYDLWLAEYLLERNDAG